MEKVIHSLIKEDQTGFIKGCNMRRLFHILDFADSHSAPCAVISLDAEKAFDRLEWNYMWAVLQCFGFGEHFISMIKMHRNENSWPKPNKMKHWAEYRTRFFAFFPPCRPILPFFFFFTIA